MKNFETFSDIFSIEIHKKTGMAESVDIPLPVDFPPHLLIHSNIENLMGNWGYLQQDITSAIKGETGLLITKGDGLTIEQIQSHMEHISGVMNDRNVKKAFNTIFILYIFESGCPMELINENIEEKITSYFFGLVKAAERKVYYGGYVDLKDTTASLSTSMKFIAPLIKVTLENLLSYNEPSMYKKLLDEEKQKYQGIQERMAKTQPVATYLLTGLCILMFLWTSLAGGTEHLLVLLRFGANYGPLLRAGEWWRLVGSLFLHIGIIHLACNMQALISIGPTLESYFGRSKFLAMYTIAGVGGSLASGYFRDIVSAGASGAIFGLFGAAAYLGYRYQNEIPYAHRSRFGRSILICIGYNLFYGFSVKGIDNLAHIGGLIAGLIFAILVSPSITKKEDEEERPLSLVGILFIALAITPFLAETYVSYRAVYASGVESYPLVEYKDSSGRIIFKYPAIMRLYGSEKDKTFFVCPGAILSFWHSDISDVPDFHKEAEGIMEGLNKAGFNITKHEVITRGNHTWFLGEGTTRQSISGLKEGTSVKIEITNEGKRLYTFRLFILSDQFTDSKSLLNIITANFLTGK